jgi:hypothetical protein
LIATLITAHALNRNKLLVIKSYTYGGCVSRKFQRKPEVEAIAPNQGDSGQLGLPYANFCICTGFISVKHIYSIQISD